MKHRCIALAAAAVAGSAGAQTFSLEGAVLDSRTSRNLGVTSERGPMAEFFRAQKAMTFGILRSAGIPLDQLSPEVRARIERFQTTNLEAFRAFSQGLDLKDQGRFQEAKDAFRRAAELDPGFQLAVEQQQAMPDVNVTTPLQMRAVVAAASTAAVDRGKTGFTVDVSRAMAALAAGQTVVAVPVPSERQPALTTETTEISVNRPGSSDRFAPNLVAGIAYPLLGAGVSIGLANANEYQGGNYVAAPGVLSTLLDESRVVLAERGGAQIANAGNAVLADGSTVYWGQWASANPNASAMVRVSNRANPEVRAPELGTVDYMFGEATRQMPTAGSATFVPLGGSMSNVSGNLSVNFATRIIGVNNLGFTLGGMTFSGLNGSSAPYSATVGSGAFGGSYSAGSCAGCPSFAPGSSHFGGNFVGREANGIVFTSIMQTGSATVPTVSGVHLFGR